MIVDDTPDITAGNRNSTLKRGDTFTIDVVFRNPARRWWQFWKPRFVPPPPPMVWRVIS